MAKGAFQMKVSTSHYPFKYVCKKGNRILLLRNILEATEFVPEKAERIAKSMTYIYATKFVTR